MVQYQHIQWYVFHTKGASYSQHLADDVAMFVFDFQDAQPPDVAAHFLSFPFP